VNASFAIPIRVYYEDTDAAGVVYYANYLRFMERARTEWLRMLGFEQDELSRDDGVVFAVRTANVEFLKPARFNELLQATVAVPQRGRASLTFAQEIRRGAEALCRAEVRIACIKLADFSPCPIPARVAARVEAWGQA
jgi:acyl-CoA thioester hydrolase